MLYTVEITATFTFDVGNGKEQITHTFTGCSLKDHDSAHESAYKQLERYRDNRYVISTDNIIMLYR